MRRLLAALWLGAMLSVLAGGARADTQVKLFKSVAGNVNFVGTQKTLRSGANGSNSCSVVAPATELKASLSGIPANAVILSAQLYWAGSSTRNKADYKINFEGAEVAAVAPRQYFSATIGSGAHYFGGAADVTAQVDKKRNGEYSFSGLTVSSGDPWCRVQGVVGGFSLLVIYSHADEPFRVLNLYEGFQYMRYSGITLNLGNFRVPDPLPANATGRLGHITWEGDPTLEQNGEELLFNGYDMVDLLNKEGNQFNSMSNINADPASHGIDFDAYTVKYPVIQAGQKSARTRYQSGQDLVLLNAEIIAVPNVPTADLVMSVTHNGAPQVGRTTSYTLSVRNDGPSTETGPITVTATLSARLKYESVSGANWTCGVSGKKISCSSPGPLAAGAALAPITLDVQARSAGTATVTAKVAGKLFDNVIGNNTASNRSSADVPRSTAYTFTIGSCQPNIAIGAAGQCRAFGGVVPAGKTHEEVFITAVSDQGMPISLSTKNATSKSFRFSLSCDMPEKGAGTLAILGGTELPECAEGDDFPDASHKAWTQMKSLTFAANSPSTRLGDGRFLYDDVGRIVLNLLDGDDKAAAVDLTSRPKSIEFVVRRNGDGVANPAVRFGGERGFVRAGEKFTLGYGATTETTPATGRFARNFDLEIGIVQIAQGDASTQTRLQGEFDTLLDGVRLGKNFMWDDVGVLEIAPSLVPNNYLDSGPVTLVPQKVGRFYPAYLQTTTEANFPCLPAMGCPLGLTGAAWSLEPFKVNVSAFSLNDSPLPNYKGPLPRKITLAAFGAAGGTAANPGAGTLTVKYPGVDAPPASADDPPMLMADYQLRAPFNAAAPRANNWGKPATIYLRAYTGETVAIAGDKTEVRTISSKRDPEPSSEGGVQIVSGRLHLAHAFGSELLRLPVRINAQYWTGTAWENNGGDNKSAVTFRIDFTSCARKLAVPTGGGSDNCQLDLLTATPAATLLKNGAGKLWLGAPGAGNVGSAWLKIKDNYPRWLPSTRARAVFGVRKSPLIYVREVY